MDKNAIKKYAVWARRELISRVSQKALQYGITEENIIPADAATVNGVVLSNEEKKQRRALIEKINDKGYQQVMEEVAYTWFNRFIALRFMEVNGYLPSHVRVFTDDENNFKPQILTEAIHLDLYGLDMDKVFELKETNDNEALFKYLLIVQCNALNPIMPRMFQKISDYTELLFPDNLLREGSVVQQMIELIPEEDWKDAVQIIGWLYQFYNTEPKSDVFSKNGRISKEEIPAATQLFTPDWMVRYMVENSLGRLWLEGHPNDELESKWKYYMDEVEQEVSVQTQLSFIRKEYAAISPEQIKCIDPCSGSGHILAYIFDVLMQIYEAYGYTAREAVRSIVENNIYGLDIDDRAAQLAYFTVMMKARRYDRRYLIRKDEDGRSDVPQPQVYSIIESNTIDKSCVEYFANGENKLKNSINKLIDELTDAKEYGSLLRVSEEDFDAMFSRFDEISEDISIYALPTLNDLMPIVRVARILAQKYDVAITNPPYLSARGGMNAKLTKYLTKEYPISKNDLFTVFMEVCNNMVKKNGFFSMINQQSWMFLAGFAKLREYIYDNCIITNLVHIGAGAFEGIAGEVVQSVAFCVRKSRNSAYKANYVKLTDGEWKHYINGFNDKMRKYHVAIDDIRNIPNGILCYWLGGAAIEKYYEGKRLDSYADPRVGMATGDNDLFVRLWQEVDFRKIGIGFSCGEETEQHDEKWFPYNKGGEYRRWYGNRTHLVDWYHNGININVFKQGRLARGEIEKKNSECWNREYYFQESISWSKVSSSRFAVRYYEPGFIFDVAGCSILGLDENLYYVMGALNSELRNAYIESLSPTLNFETGAIKAFPVIEDRVQKQQIEDLVKRCIELEKADWDSFEGSWEFKRHPLIRRVDTIEKAFTIWEKECIDRFNEVKANEEKINEIFLHIYGLEDELSATVKNEDVTVHLADLNREIKGLISYAVGCMFGRYSLDVSGLAFAGGEWDDSRYVTFKADKDSIIPICDDEYFDDDIVGYFTRFIEVVYGAHHLNENLQFIAKVLGGSGQPKDIIRKYFMDEFFKDHCSTYSVTGSGKRPIYWLFDSGKKNGFKALVYMHRYQPDTIARMRTDYVHEQQSRYRTAIADLEQRIASAATSERVKLNKKLKTLKDQAAEIQAYEEKIHHLADQYISIDLDDGVKVNYAKFQDVLAKIK